MRGSDTVPVVLPDNDPGTALRECQRLLAAGQIGRVSVRRVGPRLQVVFTLAGTTTLRVTEPRSAMAARWMREWRVLDRAAFFRECAWANNSASLHAAALRRLAEAGLIVKDHGVWVWTDRT